MKLANSENSCATKSFSKSSSKRSRASELIARFVRVIFRLIASSSIIRLAKNSNSENNVGLPAAMTRGVSIQIFRTPPTSRKKATGRRTFANFNIAVGVENVNIIPGHAAQYRCSISTLGKSVRSADIVIWGHYQLGLSWKLLAHRFSFQSDLLEWQLGADGTPYLTTGVPVE
jgi:hypothetical protein